MVFFIFAFFVFLVSDVPPASYRTCRGSRIEVGRFQEILLRLGIQEPAVASRTHMHDTRAHPPVERRRVRGGTGPGEKEMQNKKKNAF